MGKGLTESTVAFEKALGCTGSPTEMVQLPWSCAPADTGSDLLVGGVGIGLREGRGHSVLGEGHDLVCAGTQLLNLFHAPFYSSPSSQV